jgi:hypothetical protein
LRDLGTTRAACIVAAPDSPQAVTP